MASLPWIRKHSPKRTADLVGQDAAVARVRAYVENFRRGAKPLLLYGPTGTGKTATVHAIAEELDLEIIELNASDARNKDAINSLLGAALGQQSLFFRGKLLLVDEADGLSGTADRGGVAALVALLADARYPVVITANDIDSDKLKPLRKACETVEYVPLGHKPLEGLLGRIAEEEGIAADGEALSALARRSGGDARAAINDLQTLSGGTSFSLADLDALGDREQKEKVQSALMRVFKTTSAKVALPAFDNLDEDIDELFLWIDENLSREYAKPEDLARAYDALAEADRFFGRIRRWQYYRFYVYIYNLLTAGIATAKDEKYPGAREYRRSGKLLSIWILNQKNAKRKSIAQKLAAATHASAKRAVEDVAYLRPLFQNDKSATGAAAAIAHELKLEDDEIAWLKK